MQMYRGIIRSALRRSHLRVSRTTVNVASQCGTKSAFEIQNHQKLAASSNLFMISSRNFSNIHLTPTTPELYLQETTDVFSSIVDRLEADDIDGTFENEVDFSSDVINIATHAGTWVINKHNVTKQIWLSSPLSGPSKYNYHIPESASKDDISSNKVASLRGGRWLCERNDTTPLKDLLQKEFSSVFSMDVTFDFDF